MAEVALPKGLTGTENLPQTNEALVNCFNVDGKVIPRPGITQLGTDQMNLARGSFTWNGSLYAVYGKQLIKVTDLEAGTFTIIGTIDGSSVIKAVAGFNDVVILAKNSFLYTLDKSDFLTDITNNINFVPVRDLTHVDNRFIYIPTSGDPAFFSDVGAAGTVQGLSFFDAEEATDLNKAIINFSNTIFILGENSIELFRDTAANVINPFTRIQGARQRWGFIGGLVAHTKAFLYLGREAEQDFGFYGTNAGGTVKISNPFIDKILTTYAPEELADCVAGRIKWRGYDLATFTLARDSFGFYQGNWFRLNTLVDGAPKPWLGGFFTQHLGTYYTASRRKFGKFAAVNTDFGEALAKTIEMGFKHPQNLRFTCQELSLGISQGFNSGAGTVGLFMSDDNRTYGPGLFRDLGALGQYAKKLSWNYAGGLGNYDGFMGIRIYTTQDIAFASDSLFLDIG